MSDRKRKYPLPSQHRHHRPGSMTQTDSTGRSGHGNHQHSSTSNNSSSGSSRGRTNHRHGNNHSVPDINALIEEGLRLQREKASLAQTTTADTSSDAKKEDGHPTAAAVEEKPIVTPSFAANGYLSLLQSLYLSGVYGDRVRRLPASFFTSSTTTGGSRASNTTYSSPVSRGNDLYLRKHWTTLLSKPSRTHRLTYSYQDVHQRGDVLCLWAADRISLQHDDQIAYATSSTGAQRPFQFTSVSWSNIDNEYAIASLLEYNANEQGIALMNPHYQRGTVGGTMLLHWVVSAAKHTLISILWGCRNGSMNQSSGIYALGENQIHKVDVETAATSLMYTGLPEQSSSASVSARHAHKRPQKVTFFGNIQECIHAELSVCSNAQDVLVVGGRNGVIGLVDGRSKQSPSSVGKMSFGVHHMQCMTNCGYNILAQDITNSITIYDVRKESKEGISVHTAASHSSASPRFNPCRFWLSESEELLLAVASDPKDSSVLLQYYSCKGSCERLGDAFPLMNNKDQHSNSSSNASSAQRSRASVSSFSPSPYSNLTTPISQHLAFTKQTKAPSASYSHNSDAVIALLKEKFVDRVEQQLFTWKYSPH